jgi:hypothetical protein
MAISRLKSSSIASGLQKYQTLWDAVSYVPVTSGSVLFLDAGDSSSYSGSGSTWNDISGNANNGTMTNVTYSSSNGGHMVFPGNGYVNCGNASSLNISGAFTINVMLNTNTIATGTWLTLVAKGDSSYRFQFQDSSAKWAFGTSGLSSVDTYSNLSCTTNNWHMATVVYDGTTKKIYINGVLDVSGAVTGTLSTNAFNVYIGENAQATSRYFNGKISAVQIYNRSLSQSEIVQNFSYFRTRYGI